MTSAVVIYHKDCPDGLTAAWAAWLKLKDTAVYTPRHYDEPRDDDAYRGKDVYVVDFSFSLEATRRVDEVAKSLTILDHHKTAFDALKGTKYAERLRMDQSGARLAWEFFHPDVPSPTIVDYVEDNDLWRHKLPHWEEVKVAGEMVSLKDPDAIARWAVFADQLANDFNGVVAQGRAIVEYRNILIQRMCKEPGFALLAGHKVPCVNTGSWQSEVGNILSKEHPFAVIWRADKEGRFLYSLRSDNTRPEAVDVSEVAKLFGGGGHKNAAGFTSNAPPMMVKP